MCIRDRLNEWPGSAIRLRLKKNAGRSRARNFAIEHAMAEYILFIDADMVPAYDDFLERYFETVSYTHLDVYKRQIEH